jgi:hypothetical protein
VVEGSHLHPKMLPEILKLFRKGILIPYFLTTEEEDHEMFTEQWLNSSDTFWDPSSDYNDLMGIFASNFRTIQHFMKENSTNECIEVKVDFDSFEKVLDFMHSKFLSIIEKHQIEEDLK